MTTDDLLRQAALLLRTSAQPDPNWEIVRRGWLDAYNARRTRSPLRAVARRAYLWIASHDDDRPDGWWANRYARRLGEIGWKR